jgi:hypothetical protein
MSNLIDRIDRGDVVNVYFMASPALFNVEVIDLPQATGDCWELKGEDGVLHNVILFERMDLVKKDDSQF